MIEDHLNNYRLVWHSFDFYEETDELKASAFDLRDLRPDSDDDGLPRYTSVDLTHTMSQTSVDWRVTRWQSGDARVRLKREEIKFAEYNCGTLRRLVDSIGRTPLWVTPEPEAAGASAEGRVHELSLGHGGQHDDGCRAIGRQLAHKATQFDAVHFRHVDVRDQAVEGAIAGQSSCDGDRRHVEHGSA